MDSPEVERRLSALSKELGISEPFRSLEDLIDAYKSSRVLNGQLTAANRDQARAGYEEGKKRALEYAMMYDYFSRERLRGMTLAELAELLAD